MRIYLPATTTSLRAGVATGDFGRDVLAFAVTAGIREWYADEDIDELEYAASGQAVRAALRMVDADPTAGRRRVVLAFDVPADVVTMPDELDRGAVRVGHGLSLETLASVHIDDEDAETTIARAAAVVIEADLGSAGAQDVVDDAEGFELSWYAPEELSALLATLDIESER
ncbi:MAG: DUF6912 family protein [Janthinobacterium lividum]